MSKDSSEGILYIVSVPIGNLADITDRAKSILSEVDIIACEDTRVTGKLLSKLGIEDKPALRSYRDENELALAGSIVEMIKGGQRIALVSDAGTPSISDPGFRLIKACRKEGLPVTALPGACALVNALALSGLPTDAFLFAGFLPPKRSARERFLKENAEQNYTLVVYESCHRIEKFIEEIISVLGSDRVISVCREMTKMHESVLTGSAKSVQKRLLSGSKKGEFVVLIAKQSFNI